MRADKQANWPLGKGKTEILLSFGNVSNKNSGLNVKIFE